MRPLQVSAQAPAWRMRRNASQDPPALAGAGRAQPRRSVRRRMRRRPRRAAAIAQISDDSGDGHHANTDVLSAWFSEQAGALQAVVKVSSATGCPRTPTPRRPAGRSSSRSAASSATCAS